MDLKASETEVELADTNIYFEGNTALGLQNQPVDLKLIHIFNVCWDLIIEPLRNSILKQLIIPFSSTSIEKHAFRCCHSYNGWRSSESPLKYLYIGIKSLVMTATNARLNLPDGPFTDGVTKLNTIGNDFPVSNVMYSVLAEESIGIPEL